MKKTIRITETDITRIVKKVINKDNYSVGDDESKPTHILMKEIDLMLNFHYKTNSTFLRHSNDFIEKFNILESVKTNLIENIFLSNTLVLEKFDRDLDKKIISESDFDFQKELKNYFNFIKTSLSYQAGFITESQYKNYNILTEQNTTRKENLILDDKKILKEQWARANDPVGYWKILFEQLKKGGIGVKWEVANDPVKSTFMFWGPWVIWKDATKNGGWPVTFSGADKKLWLFKFQGGKYAGQPATNIILESKFINSTFNLGQWGKVTGASGGPQLSNLMKTKPKLKAKPAPAAKQEKSLWDQGLELAGDVAGSVIKGAKAVGGAVVDVAQQGYAALQGAWKKLKELGLGAFMEKFRAFLTSNYGAALQLLIEVSTEGFGAVIPIIAWGLLLQYDGANVMSGTPDWFNLIFSIIGTATTGLASKAIGAAMPFFKTAGKASSSISQSLQWLAKSKFGQLFQPFIKTITAGLGKIPGIIAKAMVWVEATFGKVFGKAVVDFFKRGAAGISKYITEFAEAITKFFKQDVVQGSKKVVAKGIQKTLSKASNLSPKLQTYLATDSGKRLASKLSVATVDKVKKELTSTIKDYSEDQALAYIDKKYGVDYGNLVRMVKTGKDIKSTATDLTKSTKDWKGAAQNLKGSGNRSAEHFKTTVAKAQDLVKKTGKEAELGSKVVTQV